MAGLVVGLGVVTGPLAGAASLIAALLAVGGITLSIGDIVTLLEQLIQAITLTLNAKTEEELDAASKALGEALVHAGVDVVMLALGAASGKLALRLTNYFSKLPSLKSWWGKSDAVEEKAAEALNKPTQEAEKTTGTEAKDKLSEQHSSSVTKANETSSEEKITTENTTTEKEYNKNSKTNTDSENPAQQDQCPPGYIDYIRNFEDDLENFKPGYHLHTGPLDHDLILLSYHADTPLGRNRSAKWWTTPKQAAQFHTVEDVRQGLALPPNWGARERMSVMKIPKLRLNRKERIKRSIKVVRSSYGSNISILNGLFQQRSGHERF